MAVLGAGAFRTNNGSEGYAAGGKLDFAGGKWKLEAGVGYADLIYDLYIEGDPVEVEQQGAIARFGAAYSLTTSFSIGLELGYIESEAGRDPSLLPKRRSRDFGISTGTAGLVLEYDTRDSTIYPTKGVNGTLTLSQGSVLQGPQRDFTRGLAQADVFFPVSEKGVLAGQATLCNVDRETPFYLACSLGGSDSFRGYSATQYINDSLVSFQLAYRGILTERLGYVFFAGAGRVATGTAKLSNVETLPAAGLGGRFRVSKKYPVDFSVDLAVNREDEATAYVYLGQRF